MKVFPIWWNNKPTEFNKKKKKPRIGVRLSYLQSRNRDTDIEICLNVWIPKGVVGWIGIWDIYIIDTMSKIDN